MSGTPKIWPAKIGTQPGVVILRGGTRPKPGRILTFRKASPGEKWASGLLTGLKYGTELVIELF